MSLERRPDRPDKPWRVRWREEGRNRSRSFGTRRAAQSFDAANRLRLEAGQSLQPERVTLDEWLAVWFDTHGRAWEASTLTQRAQVCDRHVSPHLGGAQLSGLTRGRLREWRRDMLLGGASANTVNAAGRVLSAALTAAADEGLMTGNPLLGMRAMPKAPVDRAPVPVVIVERLLRAVPSDRDRRTIALMAYAGLRPGEVRALRWADVGERAVWVGRAVGAAGVKVTKSGGVRSVPIRDELVQILKPIEIAGLVCPGDRGGVLDWHNWSTRVWRPACERIGVEGFVPYGLRHTYASLRIAEGATVVEVAVEMGHASPVTTLSHYAHLLGEAPAPDGRTAR